MIKIKKIHLILFIENQNLSTIFYQNLLRKTPNLNVPGMTEFSLTDDTVLGLMPNKGISKILETEILYQENAIPKCELYLYVEDLEAEFENVLNLGAKIISLIKDRNWGDKAFYFSDLDGHLIAFAEKLGSAE